MEERILRFLQGDIGELEARELEAWRRESPEHEAVFRQLERLFEYRRLLEPTLHQSSPPTAQDLLRRAHTRGRWLRRHSKWAAAVAAALIVAALVYQHSVRPTDGSLLRAADFVTEADEQSTVQLGDGSVVRLGPDSRLTVLAAAGERKVALSGRAFFAVTRDRDHPFTVLTDRGEVLVKGTRFDLEARRGRLQLAVVEGLVEFRAGSDVVNVKGGEVVHALEGRHPTVTEVESAPAAPSWMGNFVAFESTPLRVVADEIERRFGMRVLIMDSLVAERTVTSWSTNRTAREILAAICAAVDASCSVEDSVTVVK